MKKLLSVLALLTASASALADDQLSLSAGIEYTTGKYGGTSSTNILYVPFSAIYEADQLMFKLTVPFLSISDSGVVRGMGQVGIQTSSKGTTYNSGLGDIEAYAGYNFYDGDALLLDIVGGVKFGTADESKGMGTGENDYSAQVDGYYAIDTNMIFATAGYKLVGDPPGVILNNVAFGTLGASHELDGETSAGVRLDFAQSVIPTGEDPLEVTFFYSQKLGNDQSVQVNLLKGLSDGSPDFGISATLTGYF